jgi:hypothetical protein
VRFIRQSIPRRWTPAWRHPRVYGADWLSQGNVVKWTRVDLNRPTDG